jgi:hypothetical protein
MKKIITILLGSLLFISAANAAGMIGIKGGIGTLEGERTQDASHGTATKASGSIDNEYASIFVEVEANSMISLGLEYVPIEAKIDTEDTTNADSMATVKDFKTVYALVSFGSSPVYGKIGYSHADLSVKSNYDATTINSASDTLEGPMLGIGVQFDNVLPFLDVVRIEGNYHQFDELSITTTNLVDDNSTSGYGSGQTTEKKGEADLMTLSISLAKSF